MLLYARAGRSWVTIDKHDRAVGYVLADVFDLCAHIGIEMCCDDVHAAADLARQTGSIRSIDTIRRVREQMAGHEREPRVHELDRHLLQLAS